MKRRTRKTLQWILGCFIVSSLALYFLGSEHWIVHSIFLTMLYTFGYVYGYGAGKQDR